MMISVCNFNYRLIFFCYRPMRQRKHRLKKSIPRFCFYNIIWKKQTTLITWKEGTNYETGI